MIQDELEKMCIPDKEEQCFSTRRPRQVEFCTSTRLKHDVESELFNTAVRTGFCFEAQQSSLAKLFPNAFVGGDTKSSASTSGTLVNIFLSTDKLTHPFSSSVMPNC